MRALHVFRGRPNRYLVKSFCFIAFSLLLLYLDIWVIQANQLGKSEKWYLEEIEKFYPLIISRKTYKDGIKKMRAFMGKYTRNVRPSIANETQLKIAQVYYEYGDFKQAIQEFLKFKDTATGRDRSYVNIYLFNAYVMVRDFNNALNIANEFSEDTAEESYLKYSDKSAMEYTRLGYMYLYETEDKEKAKNYFQKAFEASGFENQDISDQLNLDTNKEFIQVLLSEGGRIISRREKFLVINNGKEIIVRTVYYVDSKEIKPEKTFTLDKKQFNILKKKLLENNFLTLADDPAGCLDCGVYEISAKLIVKGNAKKHHLYVNGYGHEFNDNYSKLPKILRDFFENAEKKFK